jgi:hypothetical protein
MATVEGISKNFGPPKGMPSADLREQRGEIVPEDQLHQHRRAAEEPDEGMGAKHQQRVARHPHQRHHDADDRGRSP